MAASPTSSSTTSPSRTCLTGHPGDAGSDHRFLHAAELEYTDDPEFAAYALYRSQTSTVDTTSELIATITEQSTTEFIDTDPQARITYDDRIFFVDQTHLFSVQ